MTRIVLLALVLLVAGSMAANSGTRAGSPDAATIAGADANGRAATFLGMTVGGKRVVFILDDVLPSPKIFDLLRGQMVRTVNQLHDEQSFNVMMAGEFLWTAYPTLEAATGATKKDFAGKIAKTHINAGIGDRLPFDEAFEKAFAMKPDEIYFFADAWGFYPRLAQQVAALNSEHQVKVHAVAFVRHDPSNASYEKFMAEFEGRMKELAKANGGQCKVVGEGDF